MNDLRELNGIKSGNDLEKVYPFLINDLMKYIEIIKESFSKNNKGVSLVDIILEYSLKNDISVELIGDAIFSDEYFKSFVKKDCELYKVILTDKKTIDDW